MNVFNHLFLHVVESGMETCVGEAASVAASVTASVTATLSRSICAFDLACIVGAWVNVTASRLGHGEVAVSEKPIHFSHSDEEVTQIQRNNVWLSVPDGEVEVRQIGIAISNNFCSYYYRTRDPLEAKQNAKGSGSSYAVERSLSHRVYGHPVSAMASGYMRLRVGGARET